MVSSKQIYDRIFVQLGAVRLDGSLRGSGMNTVWKIKEPDRVLIVKTYGSRRAPLAEFMTRFSHWLEGRTSFTPGARHATELKMLKTWKEAGFDVPSIVDFNPSKQLPVPYIAMEYIEGRLLGDILADDSVSGQRKDELFTTFIQSWAQRHILAEKRRDCWLIQEKGTFQHVMVSDDRIVTFDLETAFKDPFDIHFHIVREICGYIRSLLRILPDEQAMHFIAMTARLYPHRRLLEMVRQYTFEHPRPLQRLLLKLQRIKSGHKKTGKFNAAQKLARALSEVSQGASEFSYRRQLGFDWIFRSDFSASMPPKLAPADDSQVLHNNKGRIGFISRDKSLFTKIFRPRGLFDRIKYSIIDSQAEREWENSRLMYLCGLPVLPFYALGQRFEKGLWRQSIIVMKALTGFQSLEKTLAEPGVRDFKLKVLSSLAAACADLHNHGFHYRDLHVNNILVKEEDGSSRIYLIDTGEARRYRKIGDRRCFDDLGRLNAYASCKTAFRLFFLREYLFHRGIDKSSWKYWAREIDKVSRTILRHRREKRRKKIAGH